MTLDSNPLARDKVYAYVTQGEQVLVFRHVDVPEAGIQVPGGSVQPGEPLMDAVLREVFEETGLTDLEIVPELGDTWPEMDDDGCAGEVHHRHVFHLRATTPLPATWRHDERDPAAGGPPIRFEFFWAPLAGADALLNAKMGALAHLARE